VLHPCALRYCHTVPDFGVAVCQSALQLGFDRVAITDATQPMQPDFERYQRFVAQGLHGTMGWLANHAEVRRSLDNDGIVPGARSVICVAQRYATDGETRGTLLAHIARYAHGRDYHNHFRKLLRKLADHVRTLAPGVMARPLVDTAPVLERAWAARAGLGFIGKNGMLIIPDLGSFVIIGEVVTTLELPATPGAPMAPRCGRCTRCLDACPTAAFTAPYVLDARRCIAYLTIEHEGVIAPELESRIEPWFFGCDRCQEVCPYNRAPGAQAPPDGPFAALQRWRTRTLPELLALSPAQWDELTLGTPLRRISFDDMRRNARAALGVPPPTSPGEP